MKDIMPNFSPSTSIKERNYIEILKKHPGKILIANENAPLEGFEYFASGSYRQKVDDGGNLFTDKFRSMSLRNYPRFIKIMATNVFGIMKARRRSFTDISEYLNNIENASLVDDKTYEYLERFPNLEIWEELSNFGWKKWRVRIGFTEVPQEIIFKDKAILFKYALVAIQEMSKTKIDTAPELDAGEEVLAVYNSLGLAVNDIARWLRKEYGIHCQANHPLGGLVNTVPLAVKAGMGWCGSNGLLITPEYGQRQRIAPIFIEKPIFKFTDSDNHRWIEEYCKLCNRCQKACPTRAIFDEKVYKNGEVSGIGPSRTSIEREKCYPYFNETLGCSICVKVCPFSKGQDIYFKLKKVIEKRHFYKSK